MLDKLEIYSFLKSNGFKLINQSISKYFGDYFEILTSTDFELVFSSSKSVEAVDIRKIEDKECTYDLALIKALLHDNHILDSSTTIEEYYEFLKVN